MRTSLGLLGAGLLVLGTALPAVAVEDAGGAAPQFKEGDVITLDQVEKLKPFLPEEFWDNRDFFFYEGMQMTIGPTNYDYGTPPEYNAATERFKGQPRIGPDGSLENYTAGQPFPMDSIDCKGDPQAGVKIMWNFDYQWNGAGGGANWFYSYWDRGEQLPLYYEGTGKTILLSHRVEKEYLDTMGGDVFRGEKRKNAFGIQVDAPFDARGIMLLSYRYKSSDAPRSEAKNDDTWVYVPTLRRVRRISTAQRTDAVSGTDFTLDDLFSFAGIVPQYEWTCVGEAADPRADELEGEGLPVREGPQLRPVRALLRQRPLGAARHGDRAHEAEERRSPLPPQGSLHRQADAQRALLVRLRPEGRAVEDPLAQQALERGHEPGRRLVQALGGHREADGLDDRERHDRQRADGHWKPHRVLESHR